MNELDKEIEDVFSNFTKAGADLLDGLSSLPHSRQKIVLLEKITHFMACERAKSKLMLKMIKK